MPEVPDRARAGRAPNPRPRRAPRHLPRLARGRRQLSRARASSSARSGCRTSTRFAHYLRPDELHTAFNFDFMARPWDAASLRASIDATLAAHAPVGAPATWVLSNHDVTRPVTRYGRDGLVVRVRPQAVRDADRPRARTTAGPGRGAPHRRPARLAVPLPGRRARARRGRGPARRDPGPDARPLGRHRPGPRRLPRPAAVERRRRAVRVQPARRDGRAVAHASRRTGPT